MGPRIALSGSAGTGKTTLGRRLAADLGVPFVEEDMRRRLEGGLDVHGFSPADWRDLLTRMWSEQCAAEERAGAFVADRSPVDYAAFWLHYDLGHARAETESFMERMFTRAGRLDRIVLCPWGVLPLEDDGVRSTNRWTQLRYHSILEGLLERFVPAELVVRIPTTEDLDERLRLARGARSDGKSGPRSVALDQE